jgi:hypothetical protein
MHPRVLTNFKKAVKNTESSLLEIAWSLKTDSQSLKEILEGNRQPDDQQIEEMVRFTFKQKAIMNDKEIIELTAEVMKAQADYFRHKGTKADPEKQKLLVDSRQLEAKLKFELRSRGLL